MFILKKFFFSILIFLTYSYLSDQVVFAQNSTIYTQPNFSNCGTLQVKNNLLCVKIDSAQFENLIEFIQKSGFQKLFFEDLDITNSFITLIDSNEIEKVPVQEIMNNYKNICFELIKCNSITPTNAQEIGQTYVIYIESQDMIGIREKYKLNNYYFTPKISIKVNAEAVHGGKLKVQNDLVYVDIDDIEAQKLLKFIQKSGFEQLSLKDVTFSKPFIPVLNSDEIEQVDLPKFLKQFKSLDPFSQSSDLPVFFEPIDCKLITHCDSQQKDKIYLIYVNCAKIYNSRENFKLNNKPIVITVKVKS